jgi:hypothetical protein
MRHPAQQAAAVVSVLMRVVVREREGEREGEEIRKKKRIRCQLVIVVIPCVRDTVE